MRAEGGRKADDLTAALSSFILPPSSLLFCSHPAAFPLSSAHNLPRRLSSREGWPGTRRSAEIMSPDTPPTFKAARLVAASVVVVLALSALAGAQQAQQPPLTRDNLVTLLQTRALTNDELVQIIRRRGVDFTLTEENETA